MDYLLSPFDQKGGPRPHVKIVGGTFAGRDAREIAAEFGALHRLRPKVGVYLLHESLRLPEGDPEPDEATWASIAESWAESMGVEDFVSVAHGDGHIHIAGSRIKRDGSVVSDQHDYRRSEAAIRKIEVDFNLTLVESSHLLNPEAAVDHHSAPTRGQMIYNELSGRLPPAMAVAALIDQIIEDGATVTELILNLESAGVQVHPNIASTGRVSGLAYEVDEIRITSKAMGRGFTWANLQERGLSYEPDRDDEELRAAKSRRQLETSERIGIENGDRVAVGRDQDLQSIRQRHGAGDTNGQSAAGRDGEDKRASEGINPKVGDPDIIADRVAVGRDDDLDHLVHLAAAELDSPHRGSSAFAGDGPAGAAGDPRLAQLADHLARDLARCGEQVGRFVQAVGADSYQIMTRTPDVKDGTIRRQNWSPEQMLDPKNVKWLRSQNAAGGGIYIRAVDRRITLIDDLKPLMIEEMASRGYEAATAIETSPNNFQAWIRLVPADAPEPSSAVATQAARSLTKFFGGDPAAVGSERFGRLPGFTNRKPSHERNGMSPWVTIKSAIHQVASAGQALISKIERVFHARAQHKAEEVSRLASVASEVADRDETISLSAAENLFIRGLALSALQPGLSQSEIDFRACGLALKHGSTVEQVEAALLKLSPRIEERHPNTDDYVERTVRRASVSDYALNRPVDPDTEGPGL
jgi:hypothetical protein